MDPQLKRESESEIIQKSIEPVENPFSSSNFTTETTTEVSTRSSGTKITTQTFGVRKRVNFMLNHNNTNNVIIDNHPPPLPCSYNNDNNNVSNNPIKKNSDDDVIMPDDDDDDENIVMRKVYRKTRKKQRNSVKNLDKFQLRKFDSLGKNCKIKNVVYNGTYPIDHPICKRFDFQTNYDSLSSSELEEIEEEQEIEEITQESKATRSLSMQELVEDKNVKFNLAKMRKEFHESLVEFEKFLAKGGPGCTKKPAGTFAIDEPF